VSEAESWLLHLVPDSGELALDVGANEGSFTILLADRFEEVHAFDPNPQITPTLRQRANTCGNVRLFELAVYREPTVLTLNLYPGPEHASVYPNTVHPHERGPTQNQVSVPATALDLLGYPDHELQIEFVKIDTEGAETDVLAGAERTIRLHRPRLLIEIHNLGNLALCQAMLADWGYETDHIPHPHPGVHPGHCWLHANQTAAVAAERG
jgi:FkbM family methyltransferase